MPRLASRLAGGADRARVAALLARALADDPAMRFIFPDDTDRRTRLPRLFALLFDSAGPAGMRLLTTGGEAATLWRAPGRVHISRLEMLRRAVQLRRALGPPLGRAMRVGDANDAHMPDGDFWYLHIAGCDPAQQGRGFGAAAVRAGLRRAAGRRGGCPRIWRPQRIATSASTARSGSGSRPSGRCPAGVRASGRCCGNRTPRSWLEPR